MSRPIISRTRITLLYAGWWMVWICVQAYIMMGLGFDWKISFTDALITQLIFAMAGYTINTSMKSYQPGARNSIYVFIWSIGLAVVGVYLQKWTILQFLPADPAYPQFLYNSLILRGAFGSLMILIIAILTWFWVYVTERSEIDIRKDDAARLTREAELSNLRQQLQPHFLFNSLNSISALAGSQPDQARSMIQQLSDFLRGTIKKDDKSLVTLEEELRHLQLYLDIEKVRFGHRLKTLIEPCRECLPLTLPSLLLQPVVENAIKFGLYDTVGEIEISLKARVENSMLILEIKNPFDPATATPKTGTGFGISSVQRRLYLLYSRNDLLQTAQSESHFTTTIKIPQTL